MSKVWRVGISRTRKGVRRITGPMEPPLHVIVSALFSAGFSAGFSAVLSTGLSIGLATVISLAFPNVTAHAQTSLLVAPATYSFGSVREGDLVKASFAVRNMTSEPVTILGVQSSCACVVAVTPNLKIPAGGEQVVGVEFNTKGFAGKKVKSVRVFLDAPSKPTLVFSLSGTVEPRISAEPSRVFFGSVLVGQEKSQRVVVNLPKGARITGVRSRRTELLAALETDNAIQLNLLPSAPVGRFQTQVAIKTSDPSVPTVTLFVFADIEPEVLITPDNASFGLLREVTESSRKMVLRIQNRGRAPLSILGVESDKSEVSGTIQVVEPGRAFNLVVEVDRSLRGTIRAVLKIRTDHPVQKEVSLPVYAIIAKKGE